MSAVPFNGQTTALVEISPDGKGHMPVVRLLGDDPSTGPTAPTGLTDAELRASPVPMTDAQALAKLEQLRLQLVTMLGNTDGIEALQQNAINLLTLTNQSVDGLEALVTTLGANTDTLETLLSTITGHVDALEPLLVDLKTLATADATKQDAHTTALNGINGKLSALGQKPKATSMPVVLANDHENIPVAIAGAARTPSMSTETTAGTVAAGALSVSFANIGTASATVAGGALPQGYSVTFDAPKGDTLAAIAYTASATATLLISKIA